MSKQRTSSEHSVRLVLEYASLDDMQQSMTTQPNQHPRRERLRRTSILRSLAACACLATLAGCAARGTSNGTALVEGAFVNAADIDLLTGGIWRGTLTYLDYTSHVQTTIKSSLLLTRLPAQPDGAAAWDMRLGYADEPHANSGETAVLARGGGVFRDGNVVERTVLPDGTVRVVTEQDGRDDDRAARIRLVYLLGARQCSIQKLVRIPPDRAFFERHIYRWSR